MKANVYCHRPSTSANVLKNALKLQGVKSRRVYGIREVRPEIPLINWGCSEMRVASPRVLLNSPDKVALAISKEKSTAILTEADLSCVRITKDKAMANDWVKRGFKVLGRRDGLSSGRGIQMYSPEREIRAADFYSRVFPKTHEFRVHVCGDQVVDFVQKKAVKGQEREIDRLIRTHENGWVFAHDGIVLQDQRDIDALGDSAKRAIAALGLDFGAVDILATVTEEAPRRLRRAVICEVNSSPGLENTRTIQGYALGIRRVLLDKKLVQV